MVGERARSLLEDEFQHGHTTSGHPVGCQIAIEVVKRVVRRRLASRSTRLGEAALQRLREELADVAIVRGLGLLIGVDVGHSRRALRVRQSLENAGVIVGQEGSVVTIVPALTIPRAEFETALSLVIDAVRHTQVDNGHQERA
jgi:adenosylmethionine-8-amino-7-oxononanoate aminotransferase